LWAPSFSLPSSETLLDLLTPDSWMGDMDMGEQFLNFHLREDLQPYCGIDVRPVFDHTRKTTLWLRWNRCMMGLMSSPYVAIKSTYLGEEIIQGCPEDPTNPLHWKAVLFNLPGAAQYTPTLPWVRRITFDGKIACSIPRYVDDLRPVGASVEACWSAMHCSATYFSYLGIQITGRKTRPPSQTPGPWAGTLAFVCPSGIGIACLPEKWSKAQQCILDLQAEIEQHSSVDHKQLERTRGFFIHLPRTYPVIAPFLKGMHLTLEGWRGHRDDEMWAIARSAWEDADVSTPPLLPPLQNLPSGWPRHPIYFKT
jgi:hypothetical protein